MICINIDLFVLHENYCTQFQDDLIKFCFGFMLCSLSFHSTVGHIAEIPISSIFHNFLLLYFILDNFFNSAFLFADSLF